MLFSIIEWAARHPFISMVVLAVTFGTIGELLDRKFFGPRFRPGGGW